MRGVDFYPKDYGNCMQWGVNTPQIIYSMESMPLLVSIKRSPWLMPLHVFIAGSQCLMTSMLFIAGCHCLMTSLLFVAGGHCLTTFLLFIAGGHCLRTSLFFIAGGHCLMTSLFFLAGGSLFDDAPYCLYLWVTFNFKRVLKIFAKLKTTETDFEKGTYEQLVHIYNKLKHTNIVYMSL